MKQLALFLVLFTFGVAFGAEADLPCLDVSDPAGLSTLCGFAKPQDLQFIPSRSVVIVSEQGWKSPMSGGSISIVDGDTKNIRLGKKRTIWPAASATVSTELIGDPQCKAPPAGVFSPHGLSVLLNWTARGTILVGGQKRGDSKSWSVVFGSTSDQRIAIARWPQR